MGRWFFKKKVEAHEVAHIEWVPPYAKTVTQFMDFSKDGITQLTDLNKHVQFSLLNEETYWNHDVKDEFLSGFSKLWEKTYFEEGLTKKRVVSHTQ